MYMFAGVIETDILTGAISFVYTVTVILYRHILANRCVYCRVLTPYPTEYFCDCLCAPFFKLTLSAN